jgi:hypothetical protein
MPFTSNPDADNFRFGSKARLSDPIFKVGCFLSRADIELDMRYCDAAAAARSRHPQRRADEPQTIAGRANHRVACPALLAKIFSFPSDANHLHIHRYPVPLEGRIAIVTDVGLGMRWTRHVKRRMTLRADGEVVWS